MLISITTAAPRATELGFLLHKNPGSVFERDLSVGKVWVFYPEATDERATCALLLEVDPIGMVRSGRGGPRVMGMDQYVNDRPYVAGSLMAVAISQCFGSALSGTAKEKVERLEELWPFEVHVPAVACRGGEAMIRQFFEPLGYSVAVTGYPLNERLPEWGPAATFTVQLVGRQTVRSLLNHLYILLPALDADKHYYVGADEVEKLVRKGEEWLSAHPARDTIVRRYLKFRSGLARMALSQLQVDEVEDAVDPDVEESGLEAQVALDETDVSSAGIADQTPPQAVPARAAEAAEAADVDDERPPPLHELRLNTVLGVLRDPRRAIASVLDLGCGEGRLVQRLMRERQLTRIVGLDVSPWSLSRCNRRLRLHFLPQAQQARVNILMGSVVYRDERLKAFDAATLVEVIEHLDFNRLSAFERAIFGHARPRTVVITTPNAEYNVVWPTLPAGKFRHRDHRFEWTRMQFRDWCDGVGQRFDYAYSLHEVGPRSPEHPSVGTPTQMAVFTLSMGTLG